MFANNLFPLIWAMLFCLITTFGQNSLHFSKYIFEVNTLIHGLIAFLAGTFFSYGFKISNTRWVVASSKIGDLAILAAALFTAKAEFNSNSSIFVLLVTISFFPFYIASYSQLKRIHLIFILIVIPLTLTTQSLINSYYPCPATIWEEYFPYVCCILFWRFAFSLSFISLAKRKGIKSSHISILQIFQFFVRGLLACASQIFFYLAINTQNNIVVWPILSSAPLISSYASQILLKENMKRSEKHSLLAFASIIIFFSWVGK